MPDLVTLGSAIEMKAADDGKREVSGYLVLFGTPDEADFVGDYFTKDTDYDLNPDGTGQATMYFNHGLDPVLKTHKLNHGMKAELSLKDRGVWVQGLLDEADEYDAMVIELIEQRAAKGKHVGWSSGAPGHLVKRQEIKSGIYEITKWSLGSDASITHTPADYRNKATYKTIELLPISELPIEADTTDDVKTDSVKTSDSVDVDDRSNLNVSAKADLSDEVIIMSEQNTNEPVQETPQNEPVQPDVVAEVKGLLDDFRKELFKEPANKEIVNPAPIITEKGVNVIPNHIGGGDDSDGMKAFYHYCRTGVKNSGLKALEGGEDAEGGYIVPSPQHNMIVERRDLASIVRVVPTFSRFTTTATTYDIPVEGDDSAAMDATAEEAAATQNDPVFGNAAGVITKYTREIRYSNELADDNSANFLQFLANRVGREMAKAENAALDVELFANGTAALTLDSLSAVGAAEIPEITGLMPSSWDNGAIWNMAKSTHSLIEGVQGDVFLFASTPAGMKNADGTRTLWGYDLYYNDQVAAMGANNQVISFYNPEAVGVIDRQGLSVLVDPYTLASTGQVKLVYNFRFDVIVLQAQAVLEIICPAS